MEVLSKRYKRTSVGADLERVGPVETSPSISGRERRGVQRDRTHEHKGRGAIGLLFVRGIRLVPRSNFSHRRMLLYNLALLSSWRYDTAQATHRQGASNYIQDIM